MNVSSRNEIIQRLSAESFDILIIGGGITGAGIALDAASRGLKVGLVEKEDFAYGTSSRSTKLIHGGLRYLKQLEFGLVHEVGSERAVVHKLAPHLVVPEKMLLPLYEKRGFGSLITSFGLKLYDILAGVRGDDQRRMLTRNQTLKQEPLLKEEDVKGGAIYAEYRTDDARLTIEIIKTAVQHGAVVLNYCEVLDFIYEKEKITGVKVIDHVANTNLEVQAKIVVSAAGPWVDQLREINHSKKGKRLHLTKGVHLVLPYEKLPVKQAIYFDVEDGRMIFAIPRGRITYVGTTDTNYYDKIDDVHCSPEDAAYLIKAINRTFPSANLLVKDIESSWAGLRPLIHEEGKSASELSRKDEIFESDSGLISIAGGKLTGYRKMAERVVDRVAEESFEDRKLKDCFTEEIPFAGSDFKNYDEVLLYINSVLEIVRKKGWPDSYAHYLVHNYGKQTEFIIRDVRPGNVSLELAKAELRFTIEYEMVMKPADFLVRRTGMLYFYKSRFEEVENEILIEFQKHFGWTNEQLVIERTYLDKVKTETVNFH